MAITRHGDTSHPDGQVVGRAGVLPNAVWVHRPGTTLAELSASTRVGLFFPEPDRVLRRADDERGWYQPAELRPGTEVFLTWPHARGVAVSTTTLAGLAGGDAIVIGDLSEPTVVQRRSYFRARAAVAAHLIWAEGHVEETSTVDLSGGGAAFEHRWGSAPQSRTPLAVVLWLPDAPVHAAAQVVACGSELLRVQFRPLQTADETRLVCHVQRVGLGVDGA
jgi:hypothetical protein